MNITTLLSEFVATRPDALALIDAHQTLTYRDLDNQTARAAAFLHDQGLKASDTVLVLQPMSAELYVAMLALFRIGAIAMFLDPSAGREHIAQCCAIRAPRGFIAGRKAHLLRLTSSALRRIPVNISIGGWVPGARSWSALDRCEPHPEITRATPDTPALLTFTSGSTGRPKAAVRTHGFLLAQHAVLARHLDLQPGQIDLTTLPIFVLANLASGVTSVIPNVDLRRPGAVDPVPILAQLDALRTTRTAASPAFLERLVEYAEQELIRLPFQYIHTGGAPVFPDLLDRLAGVAPEAQITAVYGSTEAEPIAHIDQHEISNEDRHRMRTGSGLLTGTPVPELELRILRHQWGQPVGPYTDEAFAADTLPPGEAGEIAVTGPHVLKGYLNGEGETETKFEVGGVRWHRTGDEGVLDERGRLWLLGRSAARIDDERGRLYPFSVECAARGLPRVRRAALVAHEGKRLLAVEPEPGSTPDLEVLRTVLDWAELDEIRFFDHLPVDKRHNAKIDYPALRTLLSS